MKFALLNKLILLIEEIVHVGAPVVEKAAVDAAETYVAQDPKTQAVAVASADLLAASQKLKTALSDHPDNV